METLKFSPDHLWVRLEDQIARVGLSDRGQLGLGEIQAIQLPEIGDAVERGESFGEVESTRTVVELMSPITGSVAAINTDLEDSPSLVNDDPHQDGWLIEVEIADEAELDKLLDSDDYDTLVDEE